jgi:hypothetical protein
MTKLPEPTSLELKDYEYFSNRPRFIVKYKETTCQEDYPNHKKNPSKIKHYGIFFSESEAVKHFESLPVMYTWKKVMFRREFIKVVKVKDAVYQDEFPTKHLNKKDPVVKQLIKERFPNHG